MLQYFVGIVNKVQADFNSNFIKTFVLVLGFTSLYLFTANILLSFLVAPCLAFILFRWDARIYIAFGLIFLISTSLLLVFEKEYWAEEMAVYAYYMLALGVILMIVQYVLESLSQKISAGANPQESADIVGPLAKKKTVALVALASLMAVVLFAASIAFLYFRMEAGFAKNKEQVSSLIKTQLGENKKMLEKLAENQQKPAGNVLGTEKADCSGFKILVENTTTQKDLAKKVADKFKGLGCTNVYANEQSGGSVEKTLIEYCPNCLDLADNLLKVLQEPGQVSTREELSWVDGIKVWLGEDQIIIEKSQIRVSILNGSADFGAASTLEGKMTGQGFNVVKVASTGRMDYQTTLIKTTLPNLNKAKIVEKYLLGFYDVAIVGEAALPVDVEIILGAKANE